MYRRIALTIALALSLISLSLVSSDTTVRAQKPGRFAADTGVITLGPNQILRITVALGDTGTHEVKVRFRSIEYTQGTCEGSVCIHQVASETTSAPVTLTADGAASANILGTTFGGNWRGMVLSNSKDVRVTALVIDTATGKVVSNNVIECAYFEHA